VRLTIWQVILPIWQRSASFCRVRLPGWNVRLPSWNFRLFAGGAAQAHGRGAVERLLDEILPKRAIDPGEPGAATRERVLLLEGSRSGRRRFVPVRLPSQLQSDGGHRKVGIISAVQSDCPIAVGWSRALISRQ
jgi:hypothetical protein